MALPRRWAGRWARVGRCARASAVAKQVMKRVAAETLRASGRALAKALCCNPLTVAEVMLANARTIVSAPSQLSSIADLVDLPQGAMPEPTPGRCYFNGKWLVTPRYQRFKLPEGAVVHGPALLLQQDSTCFVEPGYKASVHATGNMFISLE